MRSSRSARSLKASAPVFSALGDETRLLLVSRLCEQGPLSIAKLTADYQQRLDAAKLQIEALKAGLASLQKIVDDLKSAQAKQAEDLKKKADAPAAKDGGK